MNNFSVYIKENGIYDKIYAVAIFPFSFGQLLDEQLDEARLLVKLSPKEHYEPLTEIKIDIEKRNSSGTVSVIESKYFVVAQDKSREFPVSKGTYTHELYLIERTKLLEGILCQSITFTNPLGKFYLKNPVDALCDYKSGGPVSGAFNSHIKSIKSLYKTPQENNNIFKIFSPAELGEIISAESKIFKYQDKYSDISITDTTNYNSYVEIENGKKKEKINAVDFTAKSIVLENTLKIKYYLVFTYTYADDISVYWLEVNYIVQNATNRHPLKPWTITGVINRVLELAEPIFDGEKPRYILNPAQAEKFDKIQAPEFTMTQCTLREQLKIIGGYIHAEPRLGGYIEETIQYNGITYKKGYYENMIFFDEYGTGEKSSIANAPYVYKGNSTDISQYCTDIQTNASNIVNSLNYAQGVIIDPDSTNTQTLRTDSINVKLTDSTSRVATQLPIYKITKVECGLYDDDGNWLYEPKDITSYVFEAHEYHSTLSSYEGTYPYAKCYAIYYTQGQKGLDGLFFKPNIARDSVWSRYAISNILATVNGVDPNTMENMIARYFHTLTFRVSYLPIYDAKFSHNKQLIIPTNKRFSQIYNQSENLIETSYYGENIKGVAQRLGNVEQTRTYMLSDISQIPKAGQVLDGYVISAVTTEIMPFYIKCTVALSKDFNRISQYVGINSNKRISEVSERQAYKRDILLKDYVVFTDDADKYFYTDIDGVKKQKKPSIAFNNYDAIKGCFVPTSIKPVTACVGEGLNYKCDLINNTRIKLPVISSSFGNSILFSWQYKDNYSAGERVIADQDNEVNDIVPYWQTDVPYCDYYGRIYWYAFNLFNDFKKLGFNQALTVTTDLAQTDCLIATQNAYRLRKDSRELLSFNYEVEMVTDQDDIIIGSALASKCPLVNTKNLNISKIYFFNEPINKFEKKIDISKAINEDNPAYISYSTKENIIYVNFADPVDGIVYADNFQSYAIVTPVRTETDTYEDEQGNVGEIEIQHGGDLILARNKPKSAYNGATGDTIYFIATSNPYNE